MTKKKLLIIGLAISLIIGIFTIKTGGKKNKIDDNPAINTENTTGELGKDFMSALFGVQNVTLDSSLIRSAVFKSLVPSGAFVDVNPNKGKDDPFSPVSGNLQNNILDNGLGQSLRNFDVGQTENTVINSAEIKITKITATTASISILGIPSGVVPVVGVTSTTSSVSFADFTYKPASGEYNALITGLKKGTSYSINIISPAGYLAEPAVFETK